MAVKGRPLEQDWSQEHIEGLIHLHKGRVSYVAKQLQISTHTMYDYIDRHPEIKAVIEKARGVGEERTLDVAEDTLDVLMERIEKDPASAYRSATYILNKKGKKRGFSDDSATAAADAIIEALRNQVIDRGRDTLVTTGDENDGH